VNSLDHTSLPGVKLFLDGADDYADRVQLSCGTVAARTAMLDGPYQECAIVPRPSWRNLTTADRKALISESCPTRFGNAISIIQIPADLLERFPSHAVVTAAYPGEADHTLSVSQKFQLERTDAIVTYLRQRFQHFDDATTCPIEGGVFTNPPGLPTITWDPDSRTFIGLHVDSWYAEHFPLSRREHAPNRVCVNLGQQDRFFLFLNVPIAQMYQMTRYADRNAERAHGLSAGARAFMGAFPHYPVVRVRIRPGEGYIAPTENIAHDGSSINMSSEDVTLSVRGRFALCAK
jgi:hypothetical protein